MIKKPVSLLLSILLVSITGCLKYTQNKGLNIYIQYKDAKFSGKSITVINFKEPNYARGKGKLAGTIFHENLLKSKIFYLVKLSNNSDWSKFGKTEEEMLKTAIDEGKNDKTDFILVGSINKYIFGGLNKTEVDIKVRIIEVKTGITYFMCEYSKSDLKKDVSHPFKTNITKSSDLPDKILYEMSEQIIKKLIQEKNKD